MRVNLARRLKLQKDKDAMKNMKRISTITIKRMPDSDSDTSYLGEYSNREESDYAIDRMHSIDCPINSGTKGKLLLYTSGNSKIELQMTMEQAESVSHSGECDDDVRELSKVPAIAEQLSKIDPASLSGELKDYGSWDEEERADHDQNLQRLLWIAGGDIAEQKGCDCGERGDMVRGEYRYFNGNVENYKGETPEKIREYVLRDYERMERLQRGGWDYIGIRAEAEVLIPSNDHSIAQEITSGGLWGIESDSDASYLKEIEDEELSELRKQLYAIGFSKRAISAAVKNVTRENN
jgi:hypothetical protein